MSKQFPFGGAKRYFPATITREVAAAGTGTRAEGEAASPDDTKATYRITGSSEFIVERNWYGIVWRERLLHGKSNVQMDRFASGKAPLLVDHDTGDQVGVLVNAALRNGVTDCEAKFSRSARGQEIRQDVDDDIRGSSSIGYIPKRAKLVEESQELGDLWDVTLWEPIELSLVPCPADPTVGVQRSMRDGSGGGFPPVEVEEERSMTKVVFDAATRSLIEVDASDAREAATLEQIRSVNGGGSPTPAPRIEGGGDNGAKRQAEIVEIYEMGKRYNVPVDVEWIRGGLNPDQVSRKMADLLATRGTTQPGDEALKKAGRDASKYSIQRAIQLQLRYREGGKAPDGLEGEIHREIAESLPTNYAARGGIFVPLGSASRAKRALDSVTGGAGAELVQQQRGPFIEQLRSTAILPQLGVRLLTGATGPLAFTKKTGNATVKWRAENPGTPTPKSQLSLALVLANPKTMCGNTSYSRQLATLSSEDVGAMIDDDLVVGHSLALDYAGFHGNGINEPLGLYNGLPDVQVKAMSGVPTYPKLIEMIAKVADKNAGGRGAPAWATTALMAGVLRSTLEASAAGARWIWMGTLENGDVAGYKALYSTQLLKTLGSGAEHALLFGNWSDMIIVLWDAMELLVDPYTEADEAMIRVLSFQMGDIVVRHGESFVKATGATIS